MASSARLGNRGNKRSKSYFKKCSVGKRPRWERKMDIGMKGILVTCNRDEKQCTHEAYNLLSEYSDELYGTEVDGTCTDEFESEEGDIAEALEKELSQINEKRNSKQLRFQAVDSRAKNVIFIRSKINDDPANLVHHILTKIKEAGQSKSKHIQRILPVTMTSRATLDQIEKAVKPLLEPFFHSSEAKDSTFAILYKSRNNNNQIHKGDVITVIANAVTSGAQCKHSVDLDDPDYYILVEVICNICCLSVLKDYNSLKKYNIRAIVGDEPVQMSLTKRESFGKGRDVLERKEYSQECEVKNLNRTKGPDSSVGFGKDRKTTDEEAIELKHQVEHHEGRLTEDSPKDALSRDNGGRRDDAGESKCRDEGEDVKGDSKITSSDPLPGSKEDQSLDGGISIFK